MKPHRTLIAAIIVLSVLIAGDIALTLNARERGFSILGLSVDIKSQLDRVEDNQRAVLGKLHK